MVKTRYVIKDGASMTLELVDKGHVKVTADGFRFNGGHGFDKNNPQVMTFPIGKGVTVRLDLPSILAEFDADTILNNLMEKA